MLSTAASNALLKTLEEPPDHVVFVLATTDPQKVLPTIRSRTQHFEFHLLPADELASTCAGSSTTPASTSTTRPSSYVLRAGGGSARDTLSALDQVVAAGGVPEGDEPVDALVEALVASATPARALAAVADAVSAGRDPGPGRGAAGPPARRLPRRDGRRPSPPARRRPRAGSSRGPTQLGDRATTRALEVLGEALVGDAPGARPAHPPRGRARAAHPARRPTPRSPPSPSASTAWSGRSPEVRCRAPRHAGVAAPAPAATSAPARHRSDDRGRPAESPARTGDGAARGAAGARAALQARGAAAPPDGPHRRPHPRPSPRPQPADECRRPHPWRRPGRPTSPPRARPTSAGRPPAAPDPHPRRRPPPRRTEPGRHARPARSPPGRRSAAASRPVVRGRFAVAGSRPSTPTPRRSPSAARSCGAVRGEAERSRVGARHALRSAAVPRARGRLQRRRPAPLRPGVPIDAPCRVPTTRPTSATSTRSRSAATAPIERRCADPGVPWRRAHGPSLDRVERGDPAMPDADDPIRPDAVVPAAGEDDPGVDLASLLGGAARATSRRRRVRHGRPARAGIADAAADGGGAGRRRPRRWSRASPAAAWSR